jgi:hypothetical protein
VIRQAARQLGAHVLQSWVGADLAGWKLQPWLDEHWAAEGLGPERLRECFEVACAQHLGRPLRDALQSRIDTGGALDPREVRGLLDDIAAAFGPGLGRALDDAAAAWAADWPERWRSLIWSVLDGPPFRVAAVEAAVGGSQATVRQVVKEERSREQAEAARAEQALQAIGTLLREAHDRRRAATLSADLGTLLVQHAEARCASLLAGRVASAFHRLPEVLLEGQRTVAYCRGELEKLVQGEEQDAATGEVADAVGGLIAGLRSRDWEQLAADAQAMVRSQYQSLADLCLQMSWSKRFQNLVASLQRSAAVFVQDRVGHPDVLERFRKAHPIEEDVRRVLAQLFRQAKTALGPGATATTFLALPASPFRDDIWRLASAAESSPLTAARSMNDLIIYLERESSVRSMLDSLGPAAWRAYQQALQLPRCEPTAIRPVRTARSWKRKTRLARRRPPPSPLSPLAPTRRRQCRLTRKPIPPSAPKS